jgi:hypothetical protein
MTDKEPESPSARSSKMEPYEYHKNNGILAVFYGAEAVRTNGSERRR